MDVSRRKGCGRGQVYAISHVFIIALGEFSTIFFYRFAFGLCQEGRGAQEEKGEEHGRPYYLQINSRSLRRERAQGPLET
jgi:hypothetical protein